MLVEAAEEEHIAEAPLDTGAEPRTVGKMRMVEDLVAANLLPVVEAEVEEVLAARRGRRLAVVVAEEAMVQRRVRTMAVAEEGLEMPISVMAMGLLAPGLLHQTVGTQRVELQTQRDSRNTESNSTRATKS